MTASTQDLGPSTVASASTNAASAPGAAGRLHFLDHLRAVIILLVIVLHASITFMVDPPSWWYVIAPKNSLVFTVLVLLVDVPIMQILFFIAGFFAYPSLEKHGAAGFLRQKLVRLGLPWVFGVVFLAPPVTYLITVTQGVAKPYLQFWATDFWGAYYEQSVYWYLGILLLLFAGLAALQANEPRLQRLPRQAQIPHWTVFAKFWLAALVASTGFFQRFVNRPTRLWTSLARNAYAIYYVHPLILYPAAYLAISLPLSIYPEAALLMLVTALAAWAFSALVLTRWPVLREVF